MNPNLPRCAARALAAFALALALVSAGAAPASAQQPYPSRPIRLLVPLGVGSTGDLVARAIAAHMSAALGQPLVVENKPGAGGAIAMAEAAHAAPDGYTIALASQGTLVFNPSLYPKPGYDSLRDFAALALVGSVANVMVVPAGSKITSVAEAIAAARARPAALSYSSGGSGTSHHLSGALFAQLAQAQIMHVPYRGAAQGILAVIGAQVDMGFYNTPTVLAQIGAGKLRALAVTSKTPSPLLPDVPALAASSAMAGYEVQTWFGFIAPAATPGALLATLHEAIDQALANPALRTQLSGQGLDIAGDTSARQLTRTLHADLLKWPAIIQAAGASVD